LALWVYAGFVGVVSELLGHDFIETISLSSQVHSKDDYWFAMGDTMIVSAKVKSGNAYRLNVYDNSDRLVFEDAGAVNGSRVKVSVPILPPAFNASHVYKLVFDAGLADYPLPGVDTFGSSVGAFVVVKSSTGLNLTANYYTVSHELRAVAFLDTNDAVPVQNKTVSLYMQPDLDLPMNDKGWICIGQSQTDENGSALFYVAVNGRGGSYGLETRFAGDNDFGASTSTNATSFVVVSPTPCLRVAEIKKLNNTVNLVLRVTDKYNFPLGGRLLSFEPLNLGGDPLYAISNETGYASITLNVGGLVTFVDSRISVLGDAYTSSLQATARLNLTDLTLFFEQVSGAGVSESLSSLVVSASYLPISVSLNQNPAVADLPETVSVYFLSGTFLGSIQFQFYRNGTDYLGSATASCRKYNIGPGLWKYSGTFVWYPDYYGGCSLTVNAVDVNNATVAQGSSGSFSISPAPVNLVVYYPMAFCGTTLDLSVALSRSRVYQQSASGFFQSSTLAPSLQWVGNTYMLDCGDNSTLIEVYLNGSKSVVVPNSQGFAQVSASLGVLGSNGSLSVTAHINATSRFQEVFVNHSFNFSQTSVSDVPSAGSGSFALNYSLGISDGGERTYIDLQNSVNVSASLFGFPVYNASASVVTAALDSRTATNSSGWAAIYPGCNYLRVKSACKLTQGMASPLADVDGNGVVGLTDLVLVSQANGSRLGDSRYNWRFDLNGDGHIDNADIAIVNSNYGESLTYLTGYNYSATEVDFDTGQKAYLDSQGFVRVPSGVQWLNMSIGGIVEFFTAPTAQNVSTNNLGLATANWSPTPPPGLYVVQAWLPSKFNVTWSCDIAQIPLSASVSASLNVANYFYVLKRPVDFTISLQANVSYVDQFDGTIYATAVDHVTQQPVTGLPVDFYANVQWLNENPTNQSGVALGYGLFQNFVYNITVSCADYGDNNAASAASSSFDFRRPTNVTSQPTNSWTYANRVKSLYFNFADNSSNPPGSLSGVSVDLYINGTWYNGTSPQVFTSHTNNVTLSNGTAVFNWNVPGGNGTYSLNAVFNGTANYCPCQVYDTTTVRSVPLGVLFSVTPSEFKPGDSVLLNATIIDASTGNLFTSQNVTVKFTNVSSTGSSLVVGSNSTGSTGVAIFRVSYPTDGKAYAYKAEIVPAYPGTNLTQGIVSSPVQLTVASPTVLLLNVSRDYNSAMHVIEGWLESNGAGVQNETVSVSLNGTRVFSGNITETSGHFSFKRDLEPRNPRGQLTCESATYVIEADFAGDAAVNATAYSNTLDGTSYAACTTVQYNCYKPCSNSTVVTVNPQSTQATTPTKSPKEMQKQAQDSGWLSIYDGWSWGYPWYRLHYKLSANLPQGNPKLDYGWSPLPFGDSCSADNVVLAKMLNDASTVSGPNMVQDYLVGVMIQYGAALLFGCTPMTAAMAIVLYAAYSISSSILLYEASGGNSKAWLLASIASAIGGTAGLVLSGLSSVGSFLTSVGRLILGKIQSVWYSCVAKGLGFFTIVGFAFALMDFAFAAFYLGMYISS
jgi:hypothetical protein